MSQGCCVPVLQPIWAFMDLILLKPAPVSLKLKHFFKIYINKNGAPFHDSTLFNRNEILWSYICIPEPGAVLSNFENSRALLLLSLEISKISTHIYLMFQIEQHILL